MAVSLAPLGIPAALALPPSAYLSMHSGQRHSLSGVLATIMDIGIDETLVDLIQFCDVAGAHAVLVGGKSG